MDHDENTHAYLPINALPYWERIGPFIDDVAAAVSGTRASDQGVYAATVPFVLWCWQTRGMALQRSRIFRFQVAEDFVARGMPGYLRGSRATHRATLYRVIEALDCDPSGPSPTPIGRRSPTIPYMSAEVAALHSWALTQRTPRRRTDAMILLVLGLGAGLRTKEILTTGPRDLQHARSGWQVTVWEGQPRIVPVHPDWAGPLEGLAGELEGRRWVFRPGRRDANPGQVTDFLLRARTGLDVRPVRMRTTWLISHLAEGTPPGRLLRISGLKNLAALDRLTQFLPKTGDNTGSSGRPVNGD